ncbi:MAG: hypothetical protein H6648_01415 [Caldilineae bacterium]|nr:hypothetical protein [Chloroflexota bacterium]MCB9175789.1 hypothetical protein [Caldilineae bacterium]
MFYKWPNVPPNALTEDRAERAERIAAGLAKAEIGDITRRMVTLKLPDTGELVEGDITQSGFTVYLGGFDWMTYSTPPQLLQKFPEFLPLPQQAFADGEAPELEF